MCGSQIAALLSLACLSHGDQIIIDKPRWLDYSTARERGDYRKVLTASCTYQHQQDGKCRVGLRGWDPEDISNNEASWTLPEVFFQDQPPPPWSHSPSPPPLPAGPIGFDDKNNGVGGKCLEVGELVGIWSGEIYPGDPTGDKVEAFYRLQVADCDGSPAQLWAPYKNANSWGGVCNPDKDACLFYRQMDYGDGLRLWTVLTNLTKDDAHIQVDPSTIVSQSSGKCLDLPGGDTTNGAQLWMWDCYGGPTQQFAFQNGNLVYGPDPTKCVDLLGGDTTNGNALGLWDCNGNYDSQDWMFDGKIKGGDRHEGTIHLAKGPYKIKAVSCMGASTAIGGPVYIWDCDSEDVTQTWIFGDDYRGAVSERLV